MKITIEGEPKEIAALALELQGRQMVSVSAEGVTPKVGSDQLDENLLIVSANDVAAADLSVKGYMPIPRTLRVEFNGGAPNDPGRDAGQ